MKRLTILFIALFLINGVGFCQKREPGKVKTIVIDPGHGGNKPGALGKKSKEKDLVLSISLKFGKLIADNYPDVNVVYTHTTDKDISLAERAHIANRNKADLFISIHANSHTTSGPTGVETFVMGLSQSRANMEVAKKENADILLETNYQDNVEYKGFDPNSPESYVMFAMYQNAYLDKSLDFAQYIQNEYKTHLHTIDRGIKQAELFVLYKTTMPSVLTEVGFISNPDEETFMMSDEGQAKIALSLFNAFADYKARVENTKRPANPKVDLPGYGKNKPSKQQSSDTQHIADSLAQLRLDNALAATIDGTVAEPVADTKTDPSDSPAKANVVETAPATTVPATPPTATANEVMPTPQPAPDEKEVAELTYRVQFLVSSKELKEGDKDFKGVTGYKMYQQGGSYRYTMGNESTIKRATTIQSDLRKKGFKDAFVIAFYKGQRITLQEARELENQ